MEGVQAAWNWGLAFIFGAFGLGIGFIAAWLLRPQGGRVRELETELARTRREFDAYRSEVSGHFTRTAELFQGMTRQYREVYDHLAEGAQHLCGDGPKPPRLDLPEPRLPAAVPAATPAPAAKPAAPDTTAPPKAAPRAQEDADMPGPEGDDDEPDPLEDYLGDAPRISDMPPPAPKPAQTPRPAPPADKAS